MLLVHSSSGSAFETLFTRVMDLHEPDFHRVNPWGNLR